MAKPGGDKKVQGQGINILNPNGGPAATVPYQSGTKRAPEPEALLKSLKAQPYEGKQVPVKVAPISKSKVFKPAVSSGRG